MLKIIFHYKKELILIFTSTIQLVFWLIGQLCDIYQHAVVGALYEFLALPMLVGFVVIAYLSFAVLIRHNLIRKKLLSFLSILILIITFIILK